MNDNMIKKIRASLEKGTSPFNVEGWLQTALDTVERQNKEILQLKDFIEQLLHMVPESKKDELRTHRDTLSAYAPRVSLIHAPEEIRTAFIIVLDEVQRDNRTDTLVSRLAARGIDSSLASRIMELLEAWSEADA